MNGKKVGLLKSHSQGGKIAFIVYKNNTFQKWCIGESFNFLTPHLIFFSLVFQRIIWGKMGTDSICFSWMACYWRQDNPKEKKSCLCHGKKLQPLEIEQYLGYLLKAGKSLYLYSRVISRMHKTLDHSNSIVNHVKTGQHYRSDICPKGPRPCGSSIRHNS